MINEEKEFLEEETNEVVEETNEVVEEINDVVEEITEVENLLNEDITFTSSNDLEVETEAKPKKKIGLLIAGIIIVLLMGAMIYGASVMDSSGNSNDKLTCNLSYGGMTLSQVLEYDGEEVIAVSNILIQIFTEEELQSANLTFDEYSAESEKSFAEVEDIAGTEVIFTSDKETMTITVDLRIVLADYDLEADIYGINAELDYSDLKGIEEALTSFGYACTKDE